MRMDLPKHHCLTPGPLAGAGLHALQKVGVLLKGRPRFGKTTASCEVLGAIVGLARRLTTSCVVLRVIGVWGERGGLWKIGFSTTSCEVRRVIGAPEGLLDDDLMRSAGGNRRWVCGVPTTSCEVRRAIGRCCWRDDNLLRSAEGNRPLCWLLTTSCDVRRVIGASWDCKWA